MRIQQMDCIPSNKFTQKRGTPGRTSQPKHVAKQSSLLFILPLLQNPGAGDYFQSAATMKVKIAGKNTWFFPSMFEISSPIR